MSTHISIDQLDEAIQEELTLYSREVTDEVKKLAKSSMKQLVTKTKATAPVGKRQKHYRDSISSTKLSEDARGVTYAWYVKGSDYRLSHLLEDGHALRDGGRYPGTKFIQKATEPILEQYQKEVEEVVKNG